MKEVEKDSPAEKAGLKAGDIITGVNGQRIFNALSLVDEIEKNPNAELTVDVRRGGEQLQLKMRPTLIESEGVDEAADRHSLGRGRAVVALASRSGRAGVSQHHEHAPDDSAPSPRPSRT